MSLLGSLVTPARRALLTRRANRFLATTRRVGSRRTRYTAPLIQPPAGDAVVTAETLMSVPWAWRCVRMNAGLCATMPMRDAATMGPPADFWSAPTGERAVTGFHLIRDTFIELQVHGSAFWLVVEWDAAMQPSLVVPIPADEVHMWRDPGGVLRYVSSETGGRIITDEEMIHFRLGSFLGTDRPMSPVRFMARQVAISILQSEHMRVRLREGGRSDSYWSTNERVPEEYLVSMARRVRDAWGGRNDEILAVGGGVEARTTGFTNVELELLEAKRLSAVETCALLGVPPALLGVQIEGASQTYSNVQQDLTLLDRLTLRELRRSLTEVVACYWNPVDISPIDLTEPTMVERWQAYNGAIQSGWLLPSEARRRETLPKVPDGVLRPVPGPDDPDEPDGPDDERVDSGDAP